ncbi:MAG: TRAM domain-containing protein [Kiritimatiellae bacterium]|nr:TRAM domain-containing protein [Kiritimatiellia bacterium]
MTACGERLECRVESLAYGGEGVARVNGMVFFIPCALPGETVVATVSVVKKNYARAALKEIISPSPQRITPCCRVFDPEDGALRRVPGCVYDHLDYTAEVAEKQLQLQSFLRRMPDIESAEILPPLPSPLPLNYRNKIVLHTKRTTSGMRLGYMLEQSHRLLEIPACPLACEAINRSLADLRSEGTIRELREGANVTFRHTPQDGVLCWADSGRIMPKPHALLTETTPAGTLRVPSDGFFQVNPQVGDELTRTAAAWFADGPSTSEVLDLFCGVGIFGLACAAAGEASLIGVESGRAAIAAARLNAASLGVPAKFFCSEIGRDSNSWIAQIKNPDSTTVIVDPPREGLPPSTVAALEGSGIRRVFYVSCDPATLARDLQTLLRGSYRIRRVRMFDMFPRTAHFETLVELQRVAPVF